MAGQAGGGPVAEFCAGLRRLQQDSGLDRATLARRLGYSRSQLYEILDGRISRPPEWDRLVEPLVRACTGNDQHVVGVWRRRHGVLVEVHNALRRQARQDDTPPRLRQVGPAPTLPPCPRPPAGNLRLELTELVGRAEDVARALATLAAHRVVTMTGVGGVGKTRLALRVAADAREAFPHGVWVCDVAAVRDGWQVPDVLATTLGVAQPQGLSVTDGLVEYLRSRRALLVIDNCEHVLDAAARLIDALARGCPNVTVLATSREPLGVDGEQILPVHPLAVPPTTGPRTLERLAAVPAVRLFVDRASAQATFTLDEHNVAAVSEICRRLDGLPLAIELAVTRLRSMGVGEIAGLLERRLQFLHSTRPVPEHRYSTLGAVVDWSYQLLNLSERAVFERLAVLVGAFTMADAIAIADLGPTVVIDAVAGLVNKSMLVADTGTTPTRFTMLETLRIYGRERLELSGRADDARRRHAAYCVEVAEASATGVIGPEEAHWADRITRMLDDLRHAHSWALTHDSSVAIRISAALLRYTSAHGPSEVYVWAERAVAAAGAADPDPRLAAVLSVAAAGAARRGDLAGAADLALRGLRVVPARDDPRRRFPLWLLARVASYEGRLTDAVHLYAAVAKLARTVGDAQCVAYVTASGALQHAYQGATGKAARLAGRAKDLAVATGNPTAMAWADYALGVALQDREPQRALAALKHARSVARDGHNTYIPGVAISVAATVLTRHGELRQAAALAAEVIDYWSSETHWAQQWTTLRNVIDLLTRLGEHEAAATVYGALRASKTAIQPVGADAELLDGNVVAMSEQLGAGRLAGATARGAAMSDEDTVAFVRATLDRFSATGRPAPPWLSHAP